ncbi:MAG TPA: 3-hydroxyacyl-CoA dehydrogenase [Anaerolineae bacterium]|nr:3-hydroxyacyl-CoA dehydrogenase [Anaerolineae bacterium]
MHGLDASGMVIGVAGAGTMGAGIAQVAALAGHAVVLYDLEDAYVQRGLGTLAAAIQRLADKGRLDRVAAAAAIARVTGTTSTADFAPCGLVIEAAPEDIGIKQSLFKAVEAVAAPDAVLATNTSTLSVARIAAGLARPGRVCGMHFFNPAPLMPLVEVIRGPATEADAAALVTALATAWGKTPVAAADRPGFIVNRVARPFYGEALRALGEGLADAAAIDRLARDAGFPMGPFELMDLIGIDVNFAAASSVYEGFFQDPRFRPHPIQRMMVESGRLGRKTGQGYYGYDARGAMVAAAAADGGSAAVERPAGGDGTEDLPSMANVLILAAPGQTEAEVLADRLRSGGAAVAIADTDAHLELEARQADALIDLQPSWDAARAERLTRYARWLRRGRPLLVSTETVSATRVAAAIGGLGRPERLLGFTLLPPLDKRGCLEVMAARQTDDAMRPRAEALWRTAGLDAVWIGDTVGGILPRMVACLAAEAMTAVMDGTATAEGIDQAMRLGTRYPRGPLEWLAILGAGRVAAILDALAADQGEDRYRVPPLLRRRVESGG